MVGGNCYTGAQLGASPTGKGHRTRTGFTSQADGQPPPSTSPFPTAATAQPRRVEAAQQPPWATMLAVLGSSPEQPKSSHTSASQHSSPMPHAPGRRWGSCLVALVEGPPGSYLCGPAVPPETPPPARYGNPVEVQGFCRCGLA